jgi:hypothetical protein
MRLLIVQTGRSGEIMDQFGKEQLPKLDEYSILLAGSVLE